MIEHQLRILEFQQETKLHLIQENDYFLKKECFAFLGGEEFSKNTQFFSKLQLQFAHQNHLWPESLSQHHCLFKLYALSFSIKVKKLLRHKFDHLFSHNPDIMTQFEPFLFANYKQWLNFYLLLHQTKTFQVSQIPNGFICSDRFNCGEVYRIVRL